MDWSKSKGERFTRPKFSTPGPGEYNAVREQKKAAAALITSSKRFQEPKIEQIVMHDSSENSSGKLSACSSDEKRGKENMPKLSTDVLRPSSAGLKFAKNRLNLLKSEEAAQKQPADHVNTTVSDVRRVYLHAQKAIL